MASLGNLWFGADIDLTKLKQKIQSGNQSILDALKLDYDPQSYQQMVDKLRGKLGSETFEIKLTANTSRIVHDIQNAAKGGASGTAGLDKVSEKILRQQALVNDLRAIVAKLKADYDKLGGTERKQRYIDARAELAKEHAALSNLTATRREYNRSINQTEKNKRKAERAARDLERSSLRLNTTLAGGIHVSTQLGSALSSLFAVHAARQFLNNVIEIGGQLEKQRISMGAIVGDTARANELFENIKNLAIKSPFGVVELDQYSKQLAAYGIEQSDLFNMTKRLADISAGAGQDISRLALALGHVKSATYLTGITLRQFSMNNIPMLKMLADYYSEVEKRAVSTADVQKRISKRQVSYEDVIEQIKRMTSEGGQFYNMQEKISESLQAKFKNLRDSFDIMYGEIAESGIGTALKKFAEGATDISRNWKQLLSIIGEATLVFGAYKTAIYATSYAQQNYNKNTIATALSEGRLSSLMLDRLAQSEQITKAQLLQAVAAKKLSAADAELAAASFNVTRAQLDRVAATGKYTNLLGVGSLATSKFTVAQLRLMRALKTEQLNLFNRGLKSLQLGLSVAGTFAKSAAISLAGLLKPIAGFVVFSAVVDAFMEGSRRAEEAEQRLLDMAEKANEGFNSLDETRKKFKVGASEEMTEDSIVNAIPDMVEQLKNYSKTAKDTFNNAFAINQEGKAVHSLKEQYEILAQSIDDTTEAYRKFNEIRPMIEHALQVDTPDNNFFERVGNKMFGWLLSDEQRQGMRSLTESLEYYASTVQKASVQEQLFLRNKLDVQNALASIGHKEAYDMDNQALLRLIGTLRNNAPEAFAQFYQLMNDDGKNALNSLTTAWNNMDNAWMEANLKMRNAGNDLYETFKTTFGDDMSQWPNTWRNIVMLAMDSATKDVKGFADMSEEYQNLVRNSFLHPFKIEVDSKEAQQQVNNLLVELQNLVGEEWTVQIGVKGVSVLDDLKAANKSYQEAVDGLETLYASKRKLEQQNETGSEAYKKILQNEQNLVAQRDAATGIINQYGGDLPKNKKDKGNGKTDEQLKKWREEFTELKAFYSEYRRWAKEVGNDAALETLRKTGLWGRFFKADGSTLYDMKNWENAITQFEKKISGGTTERDKLKFEVGKEKLTPMFDQAKELADALLKQLEEELKKQGKQWNLYNKILEATGSKEQASNIAFGGLIDFDNFAEQLTDEITKGLKGTKAENISIDTLLGMDEAALKKDYDLFGGIIIKLRELKEAKQQLKEEEVDIFLDALKNAKSLETELAQIKVKYDKVRKTLANDPQLLENANEQQKSEEAKVRWEWFKKSNEDWGRIFSDLDRISTTTLENMLEKLKEQIPYVQDNVEAIKALYEAIDKIQKKVTERSPFDYISKSLPLLSGLPKYSRQAKRDGDLIANKELAKLLNIKLGDKVTRKQINDALESAEADFVKGLDAITKNFKDVQDAIQPVINLFEVLGNTTLGDIFQNGSNALSAASQTTSAMKSLGLGALAPYGAAASAALSITSSLFALHDKNIQKEIDASQARQREMSNLTENIERILNRTLGGQYNLLATNKMISELQEAINNQYAKMPWGEKKHYTSDETKKALDEAKRTNTYYDYTFASMLAQRDEINHQMEAEKKKKKSDATAIQNYKKDLAELDDQIKNFATDMAKALYDIDVKSWASELGNALYEAWQKGEDGAEAFKKKASEIMATVAKNIAITKLIETAMDDTLDVIVKEMERTKGLLDEQSVSHISEEMAKVSATLPESFNKLLDGLNEGIKKAGLTDLKELADDTSKSSSNSISAKTLTEQTGDLLASYVNGVRLDVSLIRETQAQQLPIISQSLQRVSALTETQVTHLQQIATNTKRNADAADKIYNIMHKIDIGATKIIVK